MRILSTTSRTENSKDSARSAIRKLLQITELSNGSNCREVEEHVLRGVAGRSERLPRRERGRHADQREYRRNVGGFGGDGKGRASRETRARFVQSRNKPGNIARISRGGQVHRVTGKIEDRRRAMRSAEGRARESETAGEGDQMSMIMTDTARILIREPL